MGRRKFTREFKLEAVRPQPQQGPPQYWARLHRMQQNLKRDTPAVVRRSAKNR